MKARDCSFCGKAPTEDNKVFVAGGVGDNGEIIDAAICFRCITMQMQTIAYAFPVMFEAMIEEARKPPPGAQTEPAQP